MNAVTKRIERHFRGVVFLCVLLWLCAAAGCAPEPPPAGELTAFEVAGPVRPTVDQEHLVRARLATGPYRVVPDDVLELHMPAVVRDAMEQRNEKPDPVFCRVNPAGAINLPIAGEVKVAGKTLSQIESLIAAAYHPKYVKQAPSVMARVQEYHQEKVSVVGGVKQPGVWSLRSDEMTLVSALTKAGGILPDGAGTIRIRRAGAEKDSQAILLPVKGLSIPFADVPLAPGDSVEVERLNPETFAVVGLVNKPGVFPYPPETRYTLAHALASGGGVNLRADPQYAKICRQDASGRTLTIPVRIGGEALSSTAAVSIKPGDVIAVENTTATDTRMILMEVVRIGIGFYPTFKLNE